MTSLTEIKPVFIEKLEFQYRDGTILVALFGFFLILMILMQSSESTIFQPNDPLQELSFRLRLWLKKSKLYVWEIWVQKSRWNWINSFPWKFWTIRNLTHGSKWKLFQHILFYRFEFFGSGPGGRNPTCICWEKEFENRGLSIIKTNFGVFGLSELWRQAQNHPFFVGVLSYKNKFSDWDLDERIESCFLVEKRVAT